MYFLTTTITNPVFGWEGICITLALVSFFITIIVHMTAMAFGQPSLVVWAKSEYAQVAASFLILFFAAGMYDFGNRVVLDVTMAMVDATDNIQMSTLLHQAGADAITVTKAYLLQGPIACEKTIYQIAQAVNGPLEVIGTLSVDALGVEGISGGFVTSGWSSLAHYLMRTIVYLSLFHYIQYGILNFSQYTMLPIFLPIGLLFRIFPPTRGIGGLICGFALGFAFVFPMSYLLIISVLPDSFACGGVQMTMADLDPCFNNYGSIMKEMIKQKAESSEGGMIEQLVHTVSNLYMQAFMYPMVVLIVTFSFIRQTSSLLGADLAEIGRGLMKII